MYALSIGIGNLSRTLPEPVYALLSGLNAATVGIVAVSAVQLAQKAIRDKISRILIIFGACAGLCYNKLWYFPVLMLGGGLVIAAWDGWLFSHVQTAKTAWRNRYNRPADSEEASTAPVEMESIPPGEAERSETLRARKKGDSGDSPSNLPLNLAGPSSSAQSTETEVTRSPNYVIRIRTGIVITTVFFGNILILRFVSVWPILTLKSLLHRTPRCKRPTSHTSLGAGSLHKHVPRWNGNIWWRPRRDPSFTFLRRRPRLGLWPRLPYRSSHHPSLPRAKLQLRCLPGRIGSTTHAIPYGLWRISRLVGNLRAGPCAGSCVPEFLERVAEEEICHSLLKGC